MHFYFLVPNLFGFKGGIQVYSAFLIQAMQKEYPSAAYDVFLKYEPSLPQFTTEQSFLPQTQFHCFGEQVYDTQPWRRRLKTTCSCIRILSSALRQRPQLLVLTELNYYLVLCQWIKHLLGIPYWVVVHGLEAWDLKNPTYKAALQAADRVIAVSHYTRDRILREGYLEADKISVLPNTFAANQFQIKPKPDYLLKRYGLSPEQPVILTVTRIQRFSQYKGYDRILRALPAIRQQIPNVRYVLAGKGDDLQRVKTLIQQLGLEDCVTLAGFIPDAELSDHYNLCDVFAMPSKNEGFGIVYLEALACGKPVLAGNQDGAIDPLVGGKLGCLVHPEDEAAIAENLIQILQGTYANALIYQPTALRQQAIAHFEFAQFCQILQKLLENTGLR
ncbi:MAG: glycosyltransferase [Scytolyngbya sp. HA4215-MV1]|jgi:glycosyltransferase involved in cell wall biosynthesis|nr:glycosyltransferase [Scytolyngbya sp. HA4215-MV1]